MKKLFSLAILAAMALVVVSCSKDDEDSDSTDNRLKFTNLLTQNSTSGTWEGMETAQRKELGNWVDEKKRYVVIRFDRATINDIAGTGQLLAFKNSYKEEYFEGSEFKWHFEKDQLMIEWRQSGWQTAYAEYRTNEIVISGDKFYGSWFEKTDFKWDFSYTKSTFNNWNSFQQ